jgi:hypothetical protein
LSCAGTSPVDRALAELEPGWTAQPSTFEKVRDLPTITHNERPLYETLDEMPDVWCDDADTDTMVLSPDFFRDLDGAFADLNSALNADDEDDDRPTVPAPEPAFD